MFGEIPGKIKIEELLDSIGFHLEKNKIKDLQKYEKEDGLDICQVEDYADYIGAPCYDLYDIQMNKLVSVHLGDKLTKSICTGIFEELDNYFWDLYFYDIFDNFADKNQEEFLLQNQTYENLLNFCKNTNPDISWWEYKVIEFFATGNWGLLEGVDNG